MPFDFLPASHAGLATTAYDRLRAFFAETSHRPSQAQWDAIRDLFDHLERAANDNLDRAVYLSPIPAGTGKTTALSMFAKTMMDDPAWADVGMLITVNRITEAKDIARTLGEHRAKLCVITSDPAANALGANETANDAQVCICTQAALKSTLKGLAGSPFGAASRFHYHHARRAVVCWDEAFAFNRPVVLNADTVVALSEAMRRQSNEAATALKRWAADADTLTGLSAVPDFESLGVDFGRLEDDVGDKDELVAQVKALAVVSGDRGFITRQGAATSLITHYPEIPASLMPVVVTDASAKVNPSYAQMGRKVPLRWLKNAPKTYRNLSIRIVNTAASRSVYRNPKTTQGRDLLDMAVRYIETVPAGERVLVIGYKGRFKMKGVDEDSLEEALKKRLKQDDIRRLAYVTWGRHTATNDYKDVQHILLLGLNFIPKAAGHAASGAALDLNLKDEHPTEDQIKSMQRGLLMDATLQAILRGNARMGVDGDCGAMEVIIPQSKQNGLSEREYLAMFPEAVISLDQDLMPKRPLKGRLKDLAGIIERRLSAGETEMTNQSLYDELGMAQSNFATLVKKPEWQAHIACLGLQPQPLRGRAMGLRLVG